MAKILEYNIKNFKGIQSASIEVEGGKSPGRFVTLVGLNESGKTSLIESLSLSVLQDPDTADLLAATNSATDMSAIVPKHLSANFTGSFDISAKIDFTEDQKYLDEVENLIKNAGYKLQTKLPSQITIIKKYAFSESNYKNFTLSWSFAPKVKKGQAQKILDLHDIDKSTWLSCLNILKSRLPQSIYFPTFLVDFPRRIYLEGDYGVLDNYYRNIIDDALKGTSGSLSIKDHIVARVNKHRKPDTSFSSSLRSSKEGLQIDATVQQLASEINTVVFGAWSEIFSKPISNRRIVVEWHIDEEKNNHVYLEFYIISGHYRFSIPERSLGFRWFFSFLLFTQFQRARDKSRKVVFLFDEPASHLHPKAQERLLKSFEKIAYPNHVIVYSTHSHYLVNPVWLEQAYIISNSAIDAENDETGIYSVDSKVNIKSSKYKTFVNLQSNKQTYYQPILDVLDYSSGDLSLKDPVIILEGKYDYYPLKYFSDQLGLSDSFRIMPAVGAGGLSSLIGILRAWRIRFIIVLDDDATGRKEKGKYKHDLLLGDNQVVTLDEINSDFKDYEFEDIFGQDVKSACKAAGYVDGKGNVGKEQIYSYFQYPDQVQGSFPTTKALIEDLLDSLLERLNKQK